MRIRTTAAAVVLAAAVTVPMAGIALAQTGDRDCADFASQNDAQAAFEAVSGDPERLDGDDDSIACEDWPADETAASSQNETSSDDASGESGDNGTSGDANGGDNADTDQVAMVPEGGVDTGDGSTTGGAPTGLLLGGLAALGAGTVLTRRVVQRSS